MSHIPYWLHYKNLNVSIYINSRYYQSEGSGTEVQLRCSPRSSYAELNPTTWTTVSHVRESKWNNLLERSVPGSGHSAFIRASHCTHRPKAKSQTIFQGKFWNYCWEVGRPMICMMLGQLCDRACSFHSCCHSCQQIKSAPFADCF